MKIRGNTITIHLESLPINGGTLLGDLNMNSNVLFGIPNPTEDGHAVNKKYADKVAKDATDNAQEAINNGLNVRKYKSYGALSEIGLSGTKNTPDVFMAMPGESCLYTQNNADSGISDVPTQYSFVELIKHSNYGSAKAIKINSNLVEIYSGSWHSTGGFTGWKRLFTTEGGAIDGDVSINKDSWPTLLLKNAAGKNIGRVAVDTGIQSSTGLVNFRLTLGQQEAGAGGYEGYQLPAITRGLTASKFYEIITTKNPEKLGLTKTTGSGTRTETYTDATDFECTWVKWGRIVTVSFHAKMLATANALNNDYQIASNLPKAAIKQRGSMSTQAGYYDGSCGISTSGALFITNRGYSFANFDVYGEITYISES